MTGTGSANTLQTLFAPLQRLEEDVFERSLRTRDTIIYFHGNVSRLLDLIHANADARGLPRR